MRRFITLKVNHVRISDFCYTQPILEFHLSWKSSKSLLARWAAKWYYFLKDHSQILNLSSGDQTKSKMLEMKKTSNRRRPQNIKSWISLQPMARSFSNFKLKVRGPNQNHKWLKERQPPMEEDLKIIKVEGLSSRWSDLLQILNLSFIILIIWLMSF